MYKRQVLGDCKEAAVEMIEEITVQLNRQIRNDKRRRKEEGLVLKEKERGRSLLTELGRLAISRDYYYDKKNDEYVYLLDHVIGLREYERVSDGVSAKPCKPCNRSVVRKKRSNRSRRRSE